MNKKAQTITEILVVIGILFLLVSIAIPNLANFKDIAENSKIEKELQSIYSVVTLYEIDKGKYPTTWSDLETYINISKLEKLYEFNTNGG